MIDKYFLTISLVLVFILARPSPVLAVASEYSSENYKIESLNFGSEVTLFSSSESIAPTITGDNPDVTVTDTTATVTWKTDKASSSIVRYGADSTYGSEAGQSEEAVTSHSVKITGLTPLTTYHFQARSKDASANIGSSTDRTFTTLSEAAAGKISNVLIGDLTFNSAVVTWESTTITTSNLDYGPTIAYGTTVTDKSSATTTKHTLKISDLVTGTTYNLRVWGKDSNNTKLTSDNYVFMTLAFPIISNVRSSASGPNTVTILWSTNTPTSSLIEYNLESTKDNKPLSAQDKESKSLGSAEKTKDHTLKISQLDGNSVYKFRIIAQDTYGNEARSPYSTFQTSADTTPPVITNLKTETNFGTKADRAQTIVSWNTDEPSTTQVEFGQGSGVGGENYASKTDEDPNYYTNHISVVQGLLPSATFHLRAVSVDRSGNKGYSSDYTIITPKAVKSVWQLIVEQIISKLGWMRNIKLGL